ncbi:MAG: CHAD domain-containing protein [Actinomycetota bacterium]|nr:CHAD domain-containing protein [Actinomycetota bacterium]
MPTTGPATSDFTLSGSQHAGDLAESAARLRREFALHHEASDQGSVTFLDTFDWRVHTAGYVLARLAGRLELSDHDTGALVIRAPAPARLTFAGDLPAALRDRLHGALGVRAIGPVATVACSQVTLAAHNSDAKTVARLVIADHLVEHAAGQTALMRRVTVVPLRGYDKHGRDLAARLSELPGVEPAGSSMFVEAVAVSGRRPGDYSGKLALTLKRDTPAYDAARLVHRSLLATMQANEAGTIADVDSEFLHDFRVAVRRTRSALKELPGALPPEIERQFRAEFRWLGQVTTPTRDLDVYLLDFPSFAVAVGASAADLAPLHRFLRAEQRRAHTVLRRSLRSVRYRRLREEWSAAVDEDAPAAPPGPAGNAPIGPTADTRIRKVARRLLRDSGRITDESPPEAMHDLRKRAKELRYLLEFFSSLYDRKPHSAVVSELKGLQDTLGTYQDMQVQRHAIEGFADQMHTAGDTRAATLLAAGRLVATLDERQHQAREEFAERFTSFGGPRNRRRLADLTGGDL